jgi:hypothetical protein
MDILIRHDGHCDEATPDERAPFCAWSFLFLGVPSVKKRPGIAPGPLHLLR